MDDLADIRQDRIERPELAAIVLGTTPRPAGRAAWLGDGGYDVRSVTLLVLVVALLAAAVGWAVVEDRDAPSTSTSSLREPGAVDTPATGSAKAPPADEGADLRPGIDLAPGQVVARRSSNGGALLRVSVRNRGDQAMPTTDGVRVQVLVDGVQLGDQQLGAVEPGGSRTREFAIPDCVPGRHAVVVAVDPAGAVAEFDERDNASSRSIEFAC